MEIWLRHVRRATALSSAQLFSSVISKENAALSPAIRSVYLPFGAFSMRTSPSSFMGRSPTISALSRTMQMRRLPAVTEETACQTSVSPFAIDAGEGNVGLHHTGQLADADFCFSADRRCDGRNGKIGLTLADIFFGDGAEREIVRSVDVFD